MPVDLLKNKKIVLVSTVPYFMVTQLSFQIQYFASLGMDITVITSEGKELLELPQGDHIHVITINIPRKLEPWGDFKALLKLIDIFKKESFDILHSFTPKAGLLCAVAGWVAKIPLRFHTFTGQPWVTRKGFMRSMMRFSDRLIVQLMRHCYADSHSQCDFLIAEGIGDLSSISVIGRGSLGGVDTQRFSRFSVAESMNRRCQDDLNVADASCIYVYIGRMTVDKGLGELLSAFEHLYGDDPKVHLLLIGPVDDDGKKLMEQAKQQGNVHCLGYQEEPEHFLLIADVLCLPSYREGFGTVVIEAAAMGVPCIGSHIPGLVDAVENEVTGILIPVKDSESLYEAMRELSNDEQLRKKMGEAAHIRAVNWYDSKLMSESWESEYIRWFKS